MTGFGAAAAEGEGIRVSVETKSVNGRFLKTNIKLPIALARYEPEFEALIRKHVTRGSVTMSLFVEESDPNAKVSVNEEVAVAYHTLFEKLGIHGQNVAQLPGVIDPKRSLELSDTQWAKVTQTAEESLTELVQMRQFEGDKLKSVVEGLCSKIAAIKDSIAARSPSVVAEYQIKLQERIEALLQGSGTEVDPQILAREVAIFADRADVCEEVDRIAAHLEQIHEKLEDGFEIGRSLDFLAQELLRESNTIGSKSGDVEITKGVIELKAEVERFKEQVANIE